MRKDESLFVQTGDTPSRESIYNFFSGTTFRVNKPPHIEAKVYMQIDQHDPDFFQDIIVEIQIRQIDADWDRNVVIASLDLLLKCTSEDILPWIHNYSKESSKPSDKAFGEEMMKIGRVIAEYAEAFAELGAEPPSIAEGKEREEVRKFLAGEFYHHVDNFKLSVLMQLHDYDYKGFKDNPAIIEIERTGGAFAGRILTKMDRIYSFDIKTELDRLPITAIEAGAIADYIRHKLHRFEALGPVPVITQDTLNASYNAVETIDAGLKELHRLVMEIERITEESKIAMDHLFTIASTLSGASLAEYGDVNNPNSNHEDLKKLIQLSKQVISQVENQHHNYPFNTNHF